MYVGEISDVNYYTDYPTKIVESEIYEMQNGISFAYFDLHDDEGEETAFKEVVNFYQD